MSFRFAAVAAAIAFAAGSANAVTYNVLATDDPGLNNAKVKLAPTVAGFINDLGSDVTTVNWDAPAITPFANVPSHGTPVRFDADFFQPSRGVTFNPVPDVGGLTGTAGLLSCDSSIDTVANGAIEDCNPTDEVFGAGPGGFFGTDVGFDTFSGGRIFGVSGTPGVNTVTGLDIIFDTPQLGVGIVFIDNDIDGVVMEFFDEFDNSLQTITVAANNGSVGQPDGVMSFAGEIFGSNVVSRVHVNLPDMAQCSTGAAECVAIDDVIFAVSEPTSLAAVAVGGLAMLGFAARRR